ncbi:hypothetical protein RU97_GL000061 [Enterococcus canis]|uniref:Uncharacterized protein n=1 Tax=Enterococcus canis TaxID=214095 RepID=A0A1L8RJ98_9ENTE|nr:hypothetical protein [Enterococcus canis]OJG19828.1 hypothetical protein RU97_GL000061 [Enterococcus canis]
MQTVTLFQGWTASYSDYELDFFKNEELQKIVVLPHLSNDVFSILTFHNSEIELSDIYWNSKIAINYDEKRISFSKLDPEAD